MRSAVAARKLLPRKLRTASQTAAVLYRYSCTGGYIRNPYRYIRTVPIPVPTCILATSRCRYRAQCPYRYMYACAHASCRMHSLRMAASLRRRYRILREGPAVARKKRTRTTPKILTKHGSGGASPATGHSPAGPQGRMPRSRPWGRAGGAEGREFSLQVLLSYRSCLCARRLPG
jgi:hypothetical protein